MDRNVYTYEDLKEVEKSANKMYEIMYQQKHRKVKDRYSTGAFYANNFKHDKKSK